MRSCGKGGLLRSVGGQDRASSLRVGQSWPFVLAFRLVVAIFAGAASLQKSQCPASWPIGAAQWLHRAPRLPLRSAPPGLVFHST